MKLKLERYEKYFHIIFSRNSFYVTGYLRSTISMTIFAYSLGRRQCRIVPIVGKVNCLIRLAWRANNGGGSASVRPCRIVRWALSKTSGKDDGKESRRRFRDR